MKRYAYLALVVSIIVLIACMGCERVEDNVNYDNYKFETLIGKSQDEVIEIFGEDFELTEQGVNNQNLGMDYEDIGVLIGLDGDADRVVEIQLTDVEYMGVSTKFTMGAANEILNIEPLTVNISQSISDPNNLWYIYDFGAYRVRISGQSNGGIIDELVITEEDFSSN